MRYLNWASRITKMSDRNSHYENMFTRQIGNGAWHFQSEGGHLIKTFALLWPLSTNTVPNVSGSSRYQEPGKFKPFLLRCLNMALLFEKADTDFHRNWSVWLSRQILDKWEHFDECFPKGTWGQRGSLREVVRETQNEMEGERKDTGPQPSPSYCF